MRIAFTLDVDWAPDEVVADTLDLFAAHSVPCTVFWTHRTPLIDSYRAPSFEWGLHPNFNPPFFQPGDSPEQVLADLLEFIPEAEGARSHCLSQSTRLMEVFARTGLRYESNTYVPLGTPVAPFRDWFGLVRIPFSFEDDIHFSYGRDFTTIGDELPELLCVNFHPIHVFLNTFAAEHYLQAKESYHDASGLAQFRNSSRTGARNLLLDLLERTSGGEMKPVLMKQVAADVP